MKRIVITLALAACLLYAKTPLQQAALPAARHRPVVIAHRGHHTNLPENTLAAYESAIKLGADYVEVDLRTTKDSVLVVLHNASVEAMTNGKGKISELLYAQVQQLAIKAKNGNAVYRIPLFKDVLALCRGRMNIYLDFKEASVAAAWKMICEAGMQKNIVVYANTLKQLNEWQRLAPQMPVMTSVPDSINSTEALARFISQYHVAAVDGSVGQYSAAMRQLLRDRGVALWLDVQSQQEGPAVWAQAEALAAEGMQTDHPEELIQYLHQKQLR